jgi:hypothetical protein
MGECLSGQEWCRLERAGWRERKGFSWVEGLGLSLTFRKQAGGSIGHVSAEEPAIAKVVVALDEFDAVALSQAELVGAAGDKVMDDEQDRARRNLSRVRGLTRGH